MSNRPVLETTYHCVNDCRQSGCPGHRLTLQYHNTSDTVSVTQDGQHDRVYDPHELDALLRLWKRE